MGSFWTSTRRRGLQRTRRPDMQRYARMVNLVAVTPRSGSPLSCMCTQTLHANSGNSIKKTCSTGEVAVDLKGRKKHGKRTVTKKRRTKVGDKETVWKKRGTPCCSDGRRGVEISRQVVPRAPVRLRRWHCVGTRCLFSRREAHHFTFQWA